VGDETTEKGTPETAPENTPNDPETGLPEGEPVPGEEDADADEESEDE
jgi:hypothetical protein